jgi:hypothetical protein
LEEENMEGWRNLLFVAAATAATGAGAQPASAESARTYTVDPDRSNVHWRVYKAGAFSRFGHNHVISVGNMTGTVTVEPDLSAAAWELEIPVADLVVDDPSLRDLYGEDFSSEPSPEDIAGTRENMLSEPVLAGDMFRAIRVAGMGFAGEPGEATLDATVTLLGRDIELSLPASIAVDGDALTATGTFSLTHEDLGMKPFSVMMGALQVGEQLDFTYEIRAFSSQ